MLASWYVFVLPGFRSHLTFVLIEQAVAVKQLDKDGLQGNREFLVEVLMLSLLHHQNLVSLIGYCADGDQRLLVYEFMCLGSLEDHLHGKFEDSVKPSSMLAVYTFSNCILESFYPSNRILECL